MTQQSTAGALSSSDIGARHIPEFDGVHEVWPRGDRLRSVREAAAAYKPRFKAQGQVRAAHTVDITVAPYPVAFGFNNAVNVPHLPWIFFMNRMFVVQYDDWDGRANTLEDSLDQYDSMVKEKTMADPSPKDPRWLQIQSSSELMPWKTLWPVVPTHWHGGLKYGRIEAGLR